MPFTIADAMPRNKYVRLIHSLVAATASCKNGAEGEHNGS